MSRTLSFIAVMVLGVIPGLAQESGWIGISIADGSGQGAIVRRVQPNSPAEKAGIKENDVVLEFNKETVVGVQQLTRMVRETPVGRTVDVKVRRENRDQTFKVTTERGDRLQSGGRFNLEMPGIRILADRGRSFPRIEVNTTYVQDGLRVESLTDQLRDFFGVFSNTGVLVTSVEQGSTADKAGLKAGDVVTAVAGKTIRTPNDFSREMRAAGAKPMLKVFREKKERDIQFP